MPGFVPVDYKKSGILLLIIGFICFAIKFISYFTGWFFASTYLNYFGIILILLSLYLIFVVSKK